jgi:hypothetical protein
MFEGGVGSLQTGDVICGLVHQLLHLLALILNFSKTALLYAHSSLQDAILFQQLGVIVSEGLTPLIRFGIFI